MRGRQVYFTYVYQIYLFYSNLIKHGARKVIIKFYTVSHETGCPTKRVQGGGKKCSSPKICKGGSPPHLKLELLHFKSEI